MKSCLLSIAIILSAWLCAAPSHAATAYVQGCGNASGAGGTTIACAPGTVSAGAVLAGAVTFEGTTATITGCADGTNTYVIQAGTLIRDATNVRSIQGFYAENVAAGTPTVTCTVSASVARRGLVVVEISGALTSGALDQATGQAQQNPGTGTDAITSGTVTTTTDGQLIFGATGDMSVDCPTINAGTDFTLRNYSNCAGIPVQSETRIQASAAAGTAALFTNNSATDDFSTIIMTFKQIEAAAGILQQSSGFRGAIFP